MNLRMIRAMGLGMILCLSWCVLPKAVTAAQGSGKITGLVVDSTGTPQMGATVMGTRTVSEVMRRKSVRYWNFT